MVEHVEDLADGRHSQRAGYADVLLQPEIHAVQRQAAERVAGHDAAGRDHGRTVEAIDAARGDGDWRQKIQAIRTFAERHL